jgi:aminoglycoside 6'-N-acetyltransferase
MTKQPEADNFVKKSVQIHRGCDDQSMSDISFEPLRRSHFAIVSSWLSTPHVSRWWADDPALDAIETNYGGVIDGTEPSEVFIVRNHGAPIGLIQRYRYDAYPEYGLELSPIAHVPEHAYSIDYLLGPPEMLGLGLSAKMIRAFVELIWAIEPVPSCVIVPVNAANVASWRSLERTGFKRIAAGNLSPDNPIDNPAHYIYQITRPSFFVDVSSKNQ